MTESDEWVSVVGHEWAVNLLQGALRRDRLAHAYLVTGPAHIGKTTLARTFAQALNCERASISPCLECRACRLIGHDGHPDVRLVEPQLSGSGRTETIKIEQIRELQRELSLAPYEGRYRVAILSRFEQASPGAANALLKTLEEPPERVKLILTADSADSLLPTIVSRCQMLPLRPLPMEQIEAALLLHWEAEEEQAQRLAHLADGRLGLAVRWLRDPAQLEARDEQLSILESLLEADRTTRFKIAERLTQQRGGVSVQETLTLWLAWWRDVMLAAGRQGQDVSLTNIDRLETIQRAAAHYGVQEAGAAVRAIQTAIRQLDRNANVRLAVEVLLLDLPGPG